MNNPSKYRTVPDHLVDLGERVRLRLLRVLELEELSVGEAASVVQLPQSTVSRHLKVLADGGWIIKRAEGTATLYKLIAGELLPGMSVLWETIRVQLECEGLDPLTAKSHARNGHRALPIDLAEDTRRLAGVITDRRTDSQAFFGRVAGEWDNLRADLFGDRFTLCGLLTLLPREWTVADLGCGTGNASELLAPLVKQVYAIDQSAPMLAAAKKRLHGYTNISFLRGDMHGIPLEDSSVDATVTVLVLHHIERPLEACREIRRVLRPGGTCLIIDMMEHDRSIYKHTMGHRWLGFTEEKIGGLLIEAGFEKPRFNVLSPDPGARGPGLFACTAYAAG
ncbi:MAG: methyltransferase domain-containing protein [Pyrinomonadaceae bacterium]|nr:methyltransferase domain-containing protein [Phycisphaerales bacterium]